MGIVYKARQRNLNRIVAIKMVIAELGTTFTDLVRFRAEAETIAKLQHENIVHIHEIGESSGRPYLSLEYVNGGTLADLLEGHPISPQRAANLLRLLSSAAQFAHDAGIVHRDLKPMNVLITQQGIPKITDFGLAKRLDYEHSHTMTGAILGTPYYMAPEQANGRIHEIGPRTDVHALGVMLYEMLTGRPRSQSPRLPNWHLWSSSLIRFRDLSELLSRLRNRFGHQFG